MFNVLRVSRSLSLPSASRAFSTSRPVAADVAKLTLVGRLVRDPERRLTKNEKEYMSYTVATSSSTSNAEGGRQFQSTYHRILCFRPSDMEYLERAKKGSKVFVQADYSIKEADPEADPKTPQGQRHIFLTHESLKVLSQPRPTEESTDSSESSESFETTL